MTMLISHSISIEIIINLITVICEVLPIVVVHRGQCPDFEQKVDHQLAIKKLQGRWYEYARYGYKITQKCIHADYFYEDHETLSLYYSAIRLNTNLITFNKTFTEWITANATAKLIVSKSHAALNYTFTKASHSIVTGWTANPKLAVAVDYKHYLVLWSCYYIPKVNKRAEFATVLTRKSILNDSSNDQEVLNKIWSDINKFEFNTTGFTFVNHNNGCQEKYTMRDTFKSF